MRNFFTVTFLLLVIFITACSGMPERSIYFDSAWEVKGRALACNKFTKPKKWAPGHYVVTGHFEHGERLSVTRTTIAGREKGGWILESVSIDRDDKVSGMQLLVRGYEQWAEKGDLAKISVVWVRIIQADGTVLKIEGDAVNLYSMMLLSALDRLVVRGARYENSGQVIVPAGNFAGTESVKAPVTVKLRTVNMVFYFHPDVPVNGIVRATDEKGETLMELLDYGFNGKPLIK